MAPRGADWKQPLGWLNIPIYSGVSIVIDVLGGSLIETLGMKCAMGRLVKLCYIRLVINGFLFKKGVWLRQLRGKPA